MTDALVELRLQSKYGVDIYSAMIIQQPDFYIKTLKTSGISLELNYQPHISLMSQPQPQPQHEKDNNSDVENDVEENKIPRQLKVDWEYIPMSEIIPVFKVDHSIGRIHHFKKCFGTEFNSCEHIKLFEIIEIEYNKKYGTFVSQGPIYQKYNELCRKISMVEKQLDEMYKRLDADFRTELNNSQERSKIDECKILMEQDPLLNYTQIITKLEKVMDTYRDLYCQQKEKLQKMDEDKVKEKETQLKKDLTIEKNQFGQYIYKKFNLVYDPAIKSIIGTANGMGGCYPLDSARIQLCQQLKMKYFVPQ